ncbi:ATP-dependent RNA helicase, partial [Candidatus Roizmanbacteria bacterium]|nr:ATP-dependent RNA helicase [Candidatus Roizmanbacteria bacterium]
MHADSYSRIPVHHIDIAETEYGTELLQRAEDSKAKRIKLPLGPGGIGQFDRELRPFVKSQNKKPETRQFPIGQKDDEILAALETNQVIILVGPTGSGKSTHVPHMLLRSKWSLRGAIVVTQPRIQATIQIPRYVARLNNSNYGPGTEIGYTHSKASEYDRRTRLLFMTDGKLLNDIVSGQISNYSIIMIDEAHERSVNIDLILGLLNEQLYLYPHLRVIIASATIDHDAFIKYFSGNQLREVPLILSDGRFYGYQEHYWDNDDWHEVTQSGIKMETDPGWWTKVNLGSLPDRESLPEAVADLVEYLWNKPDSKPRNPETNQIFEHILVFMPGTREIDRTVSAIKARNLPNILVLPLYARRPLDEQDRALDPKDPDDKNKRRVVVSTNVAETSLTVEGVGYVVDSGYIKESYWNPRTEITELVTLRHSRSGCRQRWGRAGRLAPGEVYMLYTHQQFNEAFPSYTSPEIARSSLEDVILTAKAAGVRDILNFAWMPLALADDQERFHLELKRALNALKDKGAIDSDNDLKSFGLELRGVAVDLDIGTIFAEGDRCALGIEVATLLPFLKLDHGLLGVLKGDAEYTEDEYVIRKQHRALAYGCRDDLDLYLKLWMVWESLPSDAADRQTWCDENGIDYKRMHEDIEEERKKLIGTVMDWRKSENRTILVEKMDELRALIAYCLPNNVYVANQGGDDAVDEIGFVNWDSWTEGGDTYREYEDDFEF